LGDKIERNETGRTCSVYGERCIKGLVGKPEEGGHLGSPGLDGGIIFRCVFRKWDVGHGLNRSAPVQGQLLGFCEVGKEPPCSVK
jgi:hypothetical protein